MATENISASSNTSDHLSSGLATHKDEIDYLNSLKSDIR